MALLEKGIPHQLEFIDINSGENYEAWFVKLNSECEVPVLRDGTKIVADSARIIDYLEENYSNGNITTVLFFSTIFRKIIDTSLIQENILRSLRQNPA